MNTHFRQPRTFACQRAVGPFAAIARRKTCSLQHAALERCPMLPCPAAAAACGEVHGGIDDEPGRDMGETEGATSSSSSSTAPETAKLDLPLPSQRHQRALSVQQVKALRTESNTRAKAGTLQRIICGQKGITHTFLVACADALAKHGFLRIKLGEGAGLERGEAARALEAYLDAVAVHQVGFTITLYRELGLPRPSNCGPLPSSSGGDAAESSGGGEEDSLSVATAVLPSASLEAKRVPRQRASLKSAERAAAAKAAARDRPKGPPEFSIL